MSDSYIEEIRKHRCVLTALTIQVATKTRCAIFADLSKARVSNTCVIYLYTVEGFQTVCLIEQDWLRNIWKRYWVIPELPSTGGPVCFLEGGDQWKRKILTVHLTLKLSKLKRVVRYLRILWKQIQSLGSWKLDMIWKKSYQTVEGNNWWKCLFVQAWLCFKVNLGWRLWDWKVVSQVLNTCCFFSDLTWLGLRISPQECWELKCQVELTCRLLWGCQVCN